VKHRLYFRNNLRKNASRRQQRGRGLFSMAHLELNQQTLIECRRLASQIVSKIKPVLDANTSISVERATLRLIGIEGSVQKDGRVVALAHSIVEQLREDRVLSKG